MITILNEQRVTAPPGASAEGESLWLDRAAIEPATGWTWKPEGLCQGDVCVPLPRQTAAPIVQGDRLDRAAPWRPRAAPVVHDDAGKTWVLGTGTHDRAQALASLQAPDFELADLQGRRHRLSDFRGKKVFLATWASW